jgi:hypothetical protein
MKKLALPLLAVALWAVSTADAEAQMVYYSYYQPAVVYSPVVYSPVVAAPAPVCHTSYYAAPAPVAIGPVPVTRVRTRYRPILGGTVTRVRTGYARGYYPAPVVYAY